MSTWDAASAAEDIHLDMAHFFNLRHTSRIRRAATIGLAAHSYVPKVDDPRSDWVASVAVPAFVALAQTGVQVQRFGTIGTGAGLDALAAIEILGASQVFVTDLHEDVVELARQNITANTLATHALTVYAAAGDLLEPLRAQAARLELLYENLPNIPLRTADDLAQGTTSSTFIADREEACPEFVRRYLITLHYLALLQAQPLLQAGGRVLSSIGGRIPLSIILQLGQACGYDSEILILTWKQQSEPEEVLEGYAQWAAQSYGPFHFYPVAVLAETFGSMAAVAAGAQALEVEQALRPHAMGAQEALAAWHEGVAIGHTVAVLESIKRELPTWRQSYVHAD